MVEEGELKIHQASHARYFEDFLKFVEHGESMPEIVKTKLVSMLQEHFYEEYTEESEERERFDTAMDVWATSLKRELQKRLDTNQFMEAAAQIIEHTPDIDLRMKLDHISLNALLSDFGDAVHIAKVNGRYLSARRTPSLLRLLSYDTACGWISVTLAYLLELPRGVASLIQL
ncbi:DUF3900 domain-containing protein [Bacillus sp. V3B]|nr:DUF3900 domain-containing protein [Bacillus sp. V3B]